MRSARLRSLSLAAILLLPSLFAVLSFAPVADGALTLRLFIYIDGDGGFTNASGVVWGSGNDSDPYLIKDWSIYGYPTHRGMIEICNTTAHFEIKNVIIGKPSNIAVVLSNCTNGSVKTSVLTGSYGGVLVEHSDNISLLSNTIRSNAQFGARFDGSEDCLAFDNDFLNTTDGSGVDLRSCNDIDILNNTCEDNNHSGVSCDQCYGILVEGNMIRGNNAGVMLINNTATIIARNNIQAESHYDEFGTYLLDSSFCTVSENLIYDCWNTGILLLGSDNCSVFHNDLYDNNEQGSNVQGIDNEFDNGYPNGGNYWNDYTGTDTHTGPQQDMAGADGIGDTPYLLSSYPSYPGQDDYPLMTHWGYYSLSDALPPTTEMNLSGAVSWNGWYNPDATVTLTAYDAFSDVDKTYYRFTDGPYYWTIYVGPFEVDAQGVSIIEFFSTDSAGNSEEVKSGEICVDHSPPFITPYWSEGATLYIDASGRVILQWAAADTESGVGSFSYSLDGGTVTSSNYSVVYYEDATPGYHWIYISAEDLAGNEANISSGFNVSGTPFISANISDDNVHSGESVTVDGELSYTGGDGIPYVTLAITIRDLEGHQVIGTIETVTDGTGRFTKTIVIPSDLPTGTYLIYVVAYISYGLTWVGEIEVVNSGIALEFALLLSILALIAIIITIAKVVTERRKLPPRFD